MTVKLMGVIVTDMEKRGQGVEGDPIRTVIQYWTPDGDLLAEVDPETHGDQYYNPFTASNQYPWLK